MTADQKISGKTAIQMHTELGISGTLTIKNTTVTGFDSSINGGLWWEGINNVTTTPKPTTKNSISRWMEIRSKQQNSSKINKR